MAKRLAAISAFIGVIVLGLAAVQAPALGAAKPVKFLMLPFDASEKVVIQRAWTTFNPATGRFDLNHHAIDYVGGLRDHPDTWKKFDALAAAAGEACGALTNQGGCFDSGEIMGNRVLIKHRVEGVVYYTFYNHLDSIAKGIPLNNKNNTVHVDAGEKIGVVGKSNSQGLLHLHWELLDANFKPLDPYNIYGITDQYPDPRGKNGRHAKKSWFLTDPPVGFNAVAKPTPTPRGSGGPGTSPDPSENPAATVAPATPVPGQSTPAAGASPTAQSSPSPSSSPAVIPPANTTDAGLGAVPMAVGIGAVVVAAVLLGLLVISRRRKSTLASDENWRP